MARIERVETKTTTTSEGTSVSSRTVDTGKMLNAKYPSTVHEHPNYLIFSAVEPVEGLSSIAHGNLTASSLRNRQAEFIKGTSKEKTIARVQTYMPNMQENVQHDYSKNDSNFFGDLVSKSPDLIAALTSGNAENIVGSASGLSVGLFTEALAREASKHGLAKPVQEYTGQMFLQKQNVLYRGTAPRTQNFLFQLRPRNLDELKEIGKLISIFRVYSCSRTSSYTHDLINDSLPTISEVQLSQSFKDAMESSMFIKVPPIWYIEERLNTTSVKKNRFIDKFAFGPAALTGVKLNKSPENIYQTVSGTYGDPIVMELELSFQELIPTRAEFFGALRTNTLAEAEGMRNE